jgi:hypothetical protein
MTRPKPKPQPKPKPPVNSKPRTEVGGSSLIGEQILNQRQLKLKNIHQK